MREDVKRVLDVAHKLKALNHEQLTRALATQIISTYKDAPKEDVDKFVDDIVTIYGSEEL